MIALLKYEQPKRDVEVSPAALTPKHCEDVPMAAANSTAIIYARYSPRPEDESDSLEVQEDAVRKYFDFAGIEVGKVIGDPETSARKVPLGKRRGGAELLDLTTGRKPKYSIVGAMKMDRLWRDVVDGILTLKEWDSAGVACHFAQQGGQSINTTTATGRLVTNFLLSIAQFEPENTAERTSAALRHMQSNGFLAGGVPYGKRLGPVVDGRKTLVDDESEVTIRDNRILPMRAEGMGYYKIARILNHEGVPARGGGKWWHTTVRNVCLRGE